MEMISVIVYAVISFLIASFVHELGHVVTGLRYHWMFFLLSIGPVKLAREDKKGRLYLTIEKNPRYWGGMGGILPREEIEDNYKIYGRILLGGPIASIAFGLVAILLTFNYQSNFVDMLGLMSIAIGAANLIPMKLRNGFYYNDGTRYWRIRRGGIPALEEKELYQIAEKTAVHGENAVVTEENCSHLLHSDDLRFRYVALFALYSSCVFHSDSKRADTYRAEAETVGKQLPKQMKDMFDFDSLTAAI